MEINYYVHNYSPHVLSDAFNCIENIENETIMIPYYQSILSKIEIFKDQLYNKVLNETDLSKIPMGQLYLIGNDNVKKSEALIKNINGILVFISAHAMIDADNRYINNSIKNLIMSNNINGSRNHIKFILENVSAQYSNQNNGKLLNNIIIQYANEKYPNIEDVSYWDDDINDIHCKFSIYRICKYMNKVYMLEGALAVNISFLSYNFKPLAYIKKCLPDQLNKIQIITKVKKSIIIAQKLKNKNIINKQQTHNSNNNEIISIIDDINNVDLNKPVLSITGYSTIFKEIDNINDKNFISRNDFNQNSSNYDLYDRKIDDKKYIFSYPYIDEVYNLNTYEFEELKRFERDRLKHGS